MSSGFDPVPSDRLEVTKEEGAALTDFDYRVATSLLKLTHSLRWPKDTLSYLTEWIALEGLQVPVAQLSGFTGFTARVAQTAAEESTTSTTYTDLATSGPELTGLPDGYYLLLYGCYAVSAGAGTCRISPKVNSTEAIDGDAALMLGTDVLSIMSATTKTLSNGGNNTVTCRYRSGSALAATFGLRKLIALKYTDL